MTKSKQSAPITPYENSPKTQLTIPAANTPHETGSKKTNSPHRSYIFSKPPQRLHPPQLHSHTTTPTTHPHTHAQYAHETNERPWKITSIEKSPRLRNRSIHTATNPQSSYSCNLISITMTAIITERSITAAEPPSLLCGGKRARMIPP